MLTIGISGPPGAGKSSLVRALAARWPSLIVDYDRYRPLTRLPFEEVRHWFARGGDPNEIDHSELVAELERATTPRGPPLVLFETPFGRFHRSTAAFIDRLVWIDTPLDVALARAMLAFTRSERQKSPRREDFLDWQVAYLESYAFMRVMYVAQRERIRTGADIILDGAATPQDWVAALDAAFSLGRTFGGKRS